MAGLAVNVDHIATLRQARGGATAYPDPVHAAVLAELGGADGIVVHLREDRRHIQDRDVYLLRKTVQSRLILEMAATDEMIAIAADLRPDLVTLVPEKRTELTTEGGLDVRGVETSVRDAVERLSSDRTLVSLFVDPNPDQLDAAVACGADAVELHTGDYAETPLRSEARRESLRRLRDAADHADGIDLDV